MNSYFTYYLAWIFLSYALRTPWLLVGLAVLLVLRSFIPSPGALLRLFGRARQLRGQVEVNRANITARRDLAVIYIDALRARRAVQLLEEGLALSPNDAELLYLLGLALHRARRHGQALAPLVRAVELDARVRFGLPYAVAGDALSALKRWAEAVDAYERYLEDNSSDVSGYTRLARAQARAGDGAAARGTLREGIRTWHLLHGGLKRKQFGKYLSAHWARVTVLREPAAIAAALAVLALLGGAASYAYGPVMAWLTDSRPWYSADPERAALYDGFQRCGSQSTGDFAGAYTVLPETLKLPPLPVTASAVQRDAQQELARFRSEQYSNFEIRKDRIVSGKSLVQEYCLTRVLEQAPGELLAEAVWHEDVHDPGDASMVTVELKRLGDLVSMRVGAFRARPGDETWEIKLRRQ